MRWYVLIERAGEWSVAEECADAATAYRRADAWRALGWAAIASDSRTA